MERRPALVEHGVFASTELFTMASPIEPALNSSCAARRALCALLVGLGPAVAVWCVVCLPPCLESRWWLAAYCGSWGDRCYVKPREAHREDGSLHADLVIASSQRGCHFTTDDADVTDATPFPPGH